MADLDTDAMQRAIQQNPELAQKYRAALAGTYNPMGLPTGPDGLVLPGFRVQAAKAAAREYGVNLTGTTIDSSGRLGDPNDDNWYSDPRFWGPVAVGTMTGVGFAGAGGGAGAAAGPGTSAPAAGATAGGSTLPATVFPQALSTLPNVTPAIGAGGLAGLLESGMLPDGMPPLTNPGTSPTGNRPGVSPADAARATDWRAILKKILPAAAAVIPGAITGQFSGNGPGGDQQPIPQELQDLLALSLRRVNDQQPLVDATNAQALGGLPRRS